MQGGTLNLDGVLTLNIAGDIIIDGTITAKPVGKAANGTPGADGADGPNNQPTGLNAGRGGILGQSGFGAGPTEGITPRFDLISQGTVIIRGSIELNPKYDGGNGGRGGHGGHGGSGLSSDGPAVGGFGGQAGGGGNGGHGFLNPPTLRITAQQIELRAGCRISVENFSTGGEGGDGGRAGNGGAGGHNTSSFGRGSPGGGGGPGGPGGDGGLGGTGGNVWLTADRISLGGQISVKGGNGGDGGAAGMPGNGGNGGNAAGNTSGGRGGDSGNAVQTALRGGDGGPGGNGGTIYVRADELLVGFVPDLSPGEGGRGGEGFAAGIAKGGQGGAGSPPGDSGFDSGSIELGDQGPDGQPGRMFLYVGWNTVPFDPYWQLDGAIDCGGPFTHTDPDSITRTGFTLCGGNCLSHLVNTDFDDPLVLAFDYRWLSTTGTLEFHLADQLIHSVGAPGNLSEHFTPARIVLTDPSLRSPVFQSLQMCVEPAGSALVQLANLSLRAEPGAGTPPPVITVGRTTTGSTVEFTWTSASDQRYQLQRRDSLSTGSWTDLGSPIDGTGSTLHTSAPVNLTDSGAFYRLVVLPAAQ
jgi:hypothetical protein